MVEMKQYEPEFDQMLFNLPLSGSTFKKVYYDQLLGRCVSKFVPAEDLYVPYTTTSLDDSDCVIHSIRMTGNDLLKNQLTGFYSDVELTQSGSVAPDEIRDKKNDLEGIEMAELEKSEIYTLLECHVEMSITGFGEVDPETGEETGLKVPYILSLIHI